MSLVSLTQQPGPLRSTWLKRKKESSDEDDNDQRTAAKMPCFSWYVTLESESPQPTDEDEESIHSIQGKETDRVMDTSDTSTHTWVSSDGDVSLHVEYEVASLSEDSNSYADNMSSSGVSDIVAMGVLAFCDSDLGLADDSDDSRSSVDSEIGTADYWTCIQCNAKNNNPLFRYCEKCYQLMENNQTIIDDVIRYSCWLCQKPKRYQCFGLCQNCFEIRKNFFPPRPKWKKSRREVQSSKNNPPELTEIPTQELTSADSGLGSSQEIISQQDSKPSLENVSENLSPSDKNDSMLKTTTDQICENIVDKFKMMSKNTTTNQETDNKLCITCTAAPKNGAFVHGAITHICCCYRCAVKVWRKTKRCPICNRRVTNVLQAFFT